MTKKREYALPEWIEMATLDSQTRRRIVARRIERNQLTMVYDMTVDVPVEELVHRAIAEHQDRVVNAGETLALLIEDIRPLLDIVDDRVKRRRLQNQINVKKLTLLAKTNALLRALNAPTLCPILKTSNLKCEDQDTIFAGLVHSIYYRIKEEVVKRWQALDKTSAVNLKVINTRSQDMMPATSRNVMDVIDGRSRENVLGDDRENPADGNIDKLGALVDHKTVIKTRSGRIVKRPREIGCITADHSLARKRRMDARNVKPRTALNVPPRVSARSNVPELAGRSKAANLPDPNLEPSDDESNEAHPNDTIAPSPPALSNHYVLNMNFCDGHERVRDSPPLPPNVVVNRQTGLMCVMASEGGRAIMSRNHQQAAGAASNVEEHVIKRLLESKNPWINEALLGEKMEELESTSKYEDCRMSDTNDVPADFKAKVPVVTTVEKEDIAKDTTTEMDIHTAKEEFQPQPAATADPAAPMQPSTITTTSTPPPAVHRPRHGAMTRIVRNNRPRAAQGGQHNVQLGELNVEAQYANVSLGGGTAYIDQKDTGSPKN